MADKTPTPPGHPSDLRYPEIHKYKKAARPDPADGKDVPRNAYANEGSDANTGHGNHALPNPLS